MSTGGDYPEPNLNVPENSDELVVGKQKQNPYSVENMRKAFEALSPQTRSQVQSSDISTTHLYVKFIPKTEDELDLLELDSTLILYPYPLDHEITMGRFGSVGYRAHGVPNDQPTYQYAAVEIDKQLPPEVEYVILDELFLPDNLSDLNVVIITRSGAELDHVFVNELIEMSMRLTGNLDEPSPKTKIAWPPVKFPLTWQPKGRITYFDDSANKTIGLDGIRVTARNWFLTRIGYTNKDGYFYCDGHLLGPAEYQIKFERPNFKITKFGYGRTIEGNLNVHFSKRSTPENYFAATIFRATLFYAYKDIEGLSRPPYPENIFRAKIKLIPHMEENTNSGLFTSFSFVISGKKIDIYNPHLSTMNVYATTIHELAHSAHWRMDRYHFSNRESNIVQESWARGVEYYFTRKIYPTYTTVYGRGDYTGIAQDLMDRGEFTVFRPNTIVTPELIIGDLGGPFKLEPGIVKTSYWWLLNKNNISKSYTDYVSGYTIKQIEDALYRANGWDRWKNNLKNKFDNDTEKNVDAAFDYWSSK